MPTSKRQQILDGVVTTLAAINGGPTYNNNLSGVDQVTLKAGADTEQWAAYARWVWVHEGSEAISQTPGAISPLMEDADLEVLVDLTIRDASSDVLGKELNGFLYDVRLALNNNSSLGGVCFQARVFSVDEPVYSSDEHAAAIRVRLIVRYSYEAATI